MGRVITDQTLDTFEERFIEDSIYGTISTTFSPQRMVEVFRACGTPVVVINGRLSVEHAGYIVDGTTAGP